MSEAVKGITIQFRGDTTQLSKAINKVRQEAKGVDKELGYINNSLKFNPHNVDLLKQRLAILQDTTKKADGDIKSLKKALADMKAKGIDETNEDYRELQREIIKAESKQKAFNKEIRKLKAETSTLGQASRKMADFGSAVTKAGESLRGLSMVAGAVDVALAGLTVKAGKTADDLNTMSKVTGIGTEELQKYKLSADLLDVSVETIAKSQIKLKRSMLSAEQGSTNMASAFDTLGVAIVDSNGHLRDQEDVFSDAIKSLGKMTNETERDALAMQIFGKSASELNPLIEDNGETFQKVADIFKQNNLEIVDQETIDKANEFQDSLDTIKAMGMATLSTIGMQLAGYLAPAMEKISEVLGKVFGWLSQLDPQVLMIIGIVAGVIAVLSPLLITIGKIATGISAIMGLMSTLGVSLGAIGGVILPIIGIIAGLVAVGVLLYKNWDTIKEKATQLKDWVVAKWTELTTKVTETVTAFKEWIATTWTNIKTKVTDTATALKTSVVTIFNTLKTTVINAWTTLRDRVVGIVTSIKDKVLFYWTALKLGVEIIINAVKTTIGGVWDSIKSKTLGTFNAIKSTAVSVWNGIKRAITNPIQTAVDFISGAIAKIKGFFSGLTLELPHIKLPHFNLSGSLSIVPPSVPKLSIDWWKSGGIFTKPTLLGGMNGVGEAGAEAVLPLKKLWEEMDKRYTNDVTINVYATPGMDVNRLAEEIQNRIVALNRQKARAF